MEEIVAAAGAARLLHHHATVGTAVKSWSRGIRGQHCVQLPRRHAQGHPSDPLGRVRDVLAPAVWLQATGLGDCLHKRAADGWVGAGCPRRGVGRAWRDAGRGRVLLPIVSPRMCQWSKHLARRLGTPSHLTTRAYAGHHFHAAPLARHRCRTATTDHQQRQWRTPFTTACTR